MKRNPIFQCIAGVLLCSCMLLCVACTPTQDAGTQPGEEIQQTAPDTSNGKLVRLTNKKPEGYSILQFEFGGLSDSTFQNSMLAWDSAEPEGGMFTDDNARFYFRNGYWGIEYSFDAKLDGASMGVSMYQSFYGINNSRTAANHTGRYGNLLITVDGDMYQKIPTDQPKEETWVGKIDTAKYDLSQWHTYTFRWVRSGSKAADYCLWLYIDGEFIPFEGELTVKTSAGGKKDYFGIKALLSAGSVEVDNVSVAQANYNHSGLPTAELPNVTPADIAYNNVNGEPKVILTEDFNDGNFLGGWRVGLAGSATIDFIKTYPKEES